MVQGMDDLRAELIGNDRRGAQGPARSAPAPTPFGCRLAAVLLIVTLGAGCSAPDAVDRSPDPKPGAGQPAFPGAAVSLDELGGLVLRAFVVGDTTTLDRVLLTEEEHNSVVFPELPAGQPDVNYPVDLAWQNIRLRNDRSLARQLPSFAGRDLAYRLTQCRGATQEFLTFVVHTDCWIVFDLSGGEVREVQLFKDVVERGGAFKAFRYYDDAPRTPGAE